MPANKLQQNELYVIMGRDKGGKKGELCTLLQNLLSTHPAFQAGGTIIAVFSLSLETKFKHRVVSLSSAQFSFNLWSQVISTPITLHLNFWTI